MSNESLVVHNPNHEIISFRLDKGLDTDIASKSKAKQKKLIRTFSYNVALPSRRSVDLVVLSGLTLQEIKASPEYLQMQKKFTVMYDSSLADVEPEVVEDSETEDVDAVEAEDLDAVLPEDELESVEELMQEEYPEAIIPEIGRSVFLSVNLVDGDRLLDPHCRLKEPEVNEFVSTGINAPSTSCSVCNDEAVEEPEPEVVEPEVVEPEVVEPRTKKHGKKTVKKKMPTKRGKK
jgi:hypothetical protein